ncbi:YeiH family protein [Actinotalea sp.]|uniref:YeiH family protein n=1 Tax=Actinotalea sp. TaxID=1872145 RepID=UPI00356393FE
MDEQATVADAGARAGGGPTGGAGPAEVWRRRAPGLLAVAAASAVAFGLAGIVPGLNATTIAVLLGALAANLGLHRPALRAGTSYASKRLLRIGIVLLGLQLSLHQLGDLGAVGLTVVAVTVTLTFFGTQLLGRLLRIPPARSLLVATGFSICGASAVGAMKEVAGGDEEDTGTAIALVTLCGTLAIFLLPALRGPLGLDPTAFGTWVGASVHDVGQTVATASRVDGALTTAVVVKLSRVMLLAPLVAGVALARRRSAGVGAGRPAALPLFVVGFLAAIVIASTGWVPAGVLAAARTAQEILLVAALVGLGTGIHVAMLRRTGARALALGLSSWVLVGTVAYLGVLVAGA